MLYSQNIKNLVSGISQQPPILRLPEQLEEQINGLSTESSGLQKRPPTIHVKDLSDKLSDGTEPFIHLVDRDNKEHYIMYFLDNTLRIFDLAGGEKKVTIKEDADYLTSSDPRTDLRILTVADYTFILNRNKKVTMTSAKSPNSFATQGALIHVKQGQYGRTYKIWIDGALMASFETPDGSDKSHTKMIDTSYIVGQLAASLNSYLSTNSLTGKYSVEIGDCWLRVKGASKVATQDGFNNQAMIGLTSYVQRFNLLPATAPDGYCVKVKGDPNGDNAGSYYVQYSKDDTVWEECVAPNMPITIDASTMPHALIRGSDGSFVFQRVAWTDRKIGDDDSNPYPSFIDHTLNDIFFFRNRLGLLSSENVILSESAEYFNFWMTTANDIQDTDCIDVPTTTTRINILNYAVPFNEELYCFSDSTQFVLRSDTVLSPKNTALIEVTGFNSSPDCKPVVAGKNLYFSSLRSEYTSIKEYYNVQQVTDVKNAQDITSHVSSYIPNGVYQITPNTNENIMLFLTTGDQNCIYIYKYLFINENRVQASWSKWNMQGHVFGAFFINSTLYVLVNRGNKHMLEKINFTYNTKDFPEIEPYRVYLDSKKQASTGVYNSTYERTEYNLKTEYNLMDISHISKVGFVLSDGIYKEISAADFHDGVVYVDGKHDTEKVIVGIPYTFKATLSPIYIHNQTQNGGTESLTNGRLQIRYIKLNYSQTGGFNVYVTTNNNTYTYRMTSRVLGTTSATLGKIPDDTGTFRFPVQALNTNCSITIESDMPLPLSLIGFLWEGSWVQRSKGV